MTTLNGLTADEVKTFLELVTKANAEQLFAMRSALQGESNARRLSSMSVTA